MDTTCLAWNYLGDRDAQRLFFQYLAGITQAATTKADFLLCNTFAMLEPAVFFTQPTMTTTILPIGPLRIWQRPVGHTPVGHFWRANDEASLSFLDAQPHGSVVYVAFGSFTTMSQVQLRELELGLHASGRPFLWVCRPGLGGKLPTECTYLAVEQGKGKVVEWAPQERVLAHPAVGCFVTHCGWNSTLEGVQNAVPMLCWPYFTDQFMNQTYICDVWRVGLRVAPAGDGETVTKERIVDRLGELLGDKGVKERVRKLKDMAERSMSGEGESLKNLNAFIDSMRR